MEGDSNFACYTYENVLSKEEFWKDSETVWLMGKEFSLPDQRQQFLESARSKYWFTYRKGFTSIGGTGPTSDSGWGCMLRCGQMMLAQTLLKLRLKEDWKWRPDELQNSEYYKILDQFLDKRSSCYSIQQIAQMGVQEGKCVGEWFGPNTVAQVLKKLSAFDDQNQISIYVAMDNTICTNDVVALCSNAISHTSNTDAPPSKGSTEISSSKREDSPSSSAKSSVPKVLWKPLLIIIPLRLGLADINPVYFKNIKQCLAWKESVGIIGGKPNHAYYFIGYTNTDYLVFLDPHTTQPTSDTSDEVNISHDKSYHCESPSKMPITQLDPSLALGFLCKTKLEFDEFCQKIQNQKTTKESLPLFGIVDSMPTCELLQSRVVSVSVHNRDKKKTGTENFDDNMCLTLDSDEDLDDIDEEFEILEIL